MKNTWLILLAPALALSSSRAEAAGGEAVAAHEEGARLIKEGRLPEAVSALQRSVALDPSYPEGWADLGSAQLQQGNLKEAVRSFEKAVQLKADFQVARYNLAYSLRKSKSYRRAIDEYRRYLERDPEDADAEYGLAEALRADGQASEAADAYDAYARIEKRPAQAKWVSKAREQAEELRRSTSSSESSPPSPSLASHAPKSTPPPTTAKKSVNGSEGTGKPATGTRRSEAFNAGVNALRQSDFKTALPQLTAASKETPDDPMVLAALGSAELGVRHAAEAETAYRRALKSASKEALPGIYFGLAESLRLQGADKEALSFYEKAAADASATATIKKLATERSSALR
jgi:tetratricopeptide (TPR) repeat protein